MAAATFPLSTPMIERLPPSGPTDSSSVTWDCSRMVREPLPPRRTRTVDLSFVVIWSRKKTSSLNFNIAG
jgi:hypothetical protein